MSESKIRKKHAGSKWRPKPTPKVTAADLEADGPLPDVKMSKEERKVMSDIMLRAQKGDTAAQKSLANWYKDKLYKPIPEAIKTPRISNSDRNTVAKTIAATGNAMGHTMLVTLLNYILDEYDSFDEFVVDPDSAEMLKDGVGPALQFAFEHRISLALLE